MACHDVGVVWPGYLCHTTTPHATRNYHVFTRLVSPRLGMVLPEDVVIRLAADAAMIMGHRSSVTVRTTGAATFIRRELAQGCVCSKGVLPAGLTLCYATITRQLSLPLSLVILAFSYF